MAVVARLDIDLTFSLSENPADPDALSGRITASGLDVRVEVDRPEALIAGQSGNTRLVRDAARQLADLGLSVTLAGPGGIIASIGDVKASAAQRLVTGSRHITVGRLGALAGILRQSRRLDALTIPPGTLVPIVPTLDRRARSRVTTTHYVRGSGRPRLIFVVGSKNWDGRPPREFELVDDVTTIGSAPDATLRLTGLPAIAATIRHDDHDEFVLSLTKPEERGDLVAEMTGKVGESRILRTGARIELGQWRMGFFREEFADHGRPFGGRAGGELSVQRPQVDPRRSRPKA